MLTHRQRKATTMDRQFEERGSQPIGNLTSKIVNSLGRSASTPTPNLPSSATSGAASPAPAASRSTGQALSATTAGASIASALEGRDAEKADRALLALLRPLERSSLAPKLTSDFEVEGFRQTGAIPAAARQQLTAAVTAMIRPCGKSTAAKEALRCLSLTVSRERDGADLSLMAAALSDELSEFPADVVATAFRKWARREKWWPSLSEIRDECLRLSRVRWSLHKILRDAA